MKTRTKNNSRFAITRRSRYGATTYYIVDSLTATPLWSFGSSKREADAYLAELARDPKLVPGVKVRLIGDVHNFGASLRDELHRIVGEGNRYNAGDEGVLAFPHPNQLADGCNGWWYVEVLPKEPVERDGEKIDKLYVGVWPGGFEVLS